MGRQANSFFVLLMLSMPWIGWTCVPDDLGFVGSNTTDAGEGGDGGGAPAGGATAFGGSAGGLVAGKGASGPGGSGGGATGGDGYGGTNGGQAGTPGFEHNLVFVSSTTFTADKGSALAYDAICNELADAAGINEPGGAYVALVSDSTSLARTRLGNARGWIRVDGEPFADSLETLAQGEIFNDIRYDEHGTLTPNEYGTALMTGTKADLTLGDTCGDWSGASGSVTAGYSRAGPFHWTQGTPLDCAASARVMCLGKTKSAQVLPKVSTGRRIWLTNSSYVVGGSLTPDAACSAERPTGVAAAAAFIAYTNKAASSVLDYASIYVRPDGTVVASGNALAVGDLLDSGVWQAADGSYVSSYAWQGSQSPTLLAEDNCTDWSDSDASGTVSTAPTPRTAHWWTGSYGGLCDANYRLICVETEP